MISAAPIKLILVRHGNTFEKGETPTQVGSSTDLPLTTQGRKQAEDFAYYLAANHDVPAAIFAGTLKRQTETAQIVGKQLGVESLIHLGESALTEVDYGLWEGLTSDEITSRWPIEYANWTEKALWGAGIFGGDLNTHLKGIEGWVQQLRHSYQAGDIVVGVTSNGVIRFFYAFLAADWQRLSQERKMEDLKVKTGHFCELLLFPHKIEVKSWNQDPKI